MHGPWTIRDATAADASECADIYAPYVLDTVVSLEEIPPSGQEMAARMATAQRRHAWLVATDAEQMLGYAYGGPHNPRAGYRWACEVSVYVAAGRQRSGLGRALYQDLFSRLADRGYRTVLAGMTLPNEASEGLHRALGFEPVARYRRVGFKHGSWYDVGWMQRVIADGPDPPSEPR